MNSERIVWLSWHPGRRVVWPLLSLLLGTAVTVAVFRYYGPAGAVVTLWGISALYLLVVCYHVLILERQSLKSIGFTERGWPQAMALGAALGVLIAGTQLSAYLIAGKPLVSPAMSLQLWAFLVPLALVVAGEEFLFRGWLQHLVEPALGLVPALLLSALAYSLVPMVLAAHPSPLSRFMPLPLNNHALTLPTFLTIFSVALFLAAAYRATGSLWASGLGNYLSRLALVFVLAPSELVLGAPALLLSVAFALWTVVILYAIRWHRLAGPHLQSL